MSTKFSRKTFLKGSVAGLGMMALNVCTAGAASAAEPAAAAAEDTNSLNLVPKKAASVKVTSRGSVSGGWQGEPVFPNWKGLDDTLAMNHMYTFVGYAGQGTLCVEPEAGVTGFNLFVNNRQINTAAMAAGGFFSRSRRPFSRLCASAPYWADALEAQSLMCMVKSMRLVPDQSGVL